MKILKTLILISTMMLVSCDQFEDHPPTKSYLTRCDDVPNDLSKHFDSTVILRWDCDWQSYYVEGEVSIIYNKDSIAVGLYKPSTMSSEFFETLPSVTITPSNE